MKKDILSVDKVTNGGIMESKGASGAMVISLYYPVFENNNCIGYVGSAVYADRLMDSISSLEIKGLPNKEYIFLNVADARYIYNEDNELINQISEDKGCLEIVDIIKGGNADLVGSYSYTDTDGTQYLSVYNYMADRNWIFMVKDQYSEVFSSISMIRQHRTITGCRLCRTLACIFSVILHKFRLTGDSPPALNLYNLTKNLTSQSHDNNYAVLP